MCIAVGGSFWNFSAKYPLYICPVMARLSTKGLGQEPFLRHHGSMNTDTPIATILATKREKILRAREIAGARSRGEMTLPTPARRRELRVSAGLTQSDIAEVLGCSPPSVTRYENGSSEPTGEMLLRYSRLMRELAKLEREAVT